MSTQIFLLFSRLRRDTRGVSSMDYGILAAAIVVAVITATTTLGGYISSAVGRIGTALS